VIGDTDLSSEFYFDEHERVLTVNVKDDYNSLPKKVIAAYGALIRTRKFNYVFKTDDDQMLNDPGFFNILRNKLEVPQAPHYGGSIVEVKKPYLSQYHKVHPELPPNLPIYATKYCSGRFYFLSYYAISDLVSKRHAIETEYFEDYAIGRYLGPRFKENMMAIPTNTWFVDIPEDVLST
jgi:hypothetical protein